MTLKIYNTLTRKKEDFQTLEDEKVRMYVCGPTVYNKAHIGHAMSAMVFDIIRRYLEFRGYSVLHAMNFTDVDDKIIHRANELGVDPFELAEGYIHEFEDDLEALNVLQPTIKPRATQEIHTIIAMIEDLVKAGFAYPLNGDVYFRVRKDADYGRLSGRNLDDMRSGARIEVDNRKEDPLDFALWKSAKPGEPFWDSPWGPGRPGWHIECSAMNLHHLGEQIDIHGGGNDLIFPHHENEIAQTESLTGKPFARYWVHNGMLQLGGEKMSKSIGNLVSIEEFLSHHTSDTFRIMLLNSSYRGPLTYNEETVAQAERGLERLHSALRPALPEAAGAAEPTLTALQTQMEAAEAGFIKAMDDDFNSAGALAQLFELVRSINQARAAGASNGDLQPAQTLLRKLSGVLGLCLEEKTSQSGGGADPFIQLLIELRQELRKEKLYPLSDLVRNRLAELGVILEDSKDGVSWRWQ
ncbi:MAG: cysteine--tRNA ligase [Anaerolineaceae bacterium]|nr:cysteine--tRNA ligase [Anaerolineaceae bacterium]